MNRVAVPVVHSQVSYGREKQSSQRFSGPPDTSCSEYTGQTMCSVDALDWVLPYTADEAATISQRRPLHHLTGLLTPSSVSFNSSEESGLSTPTENLFAEQLLADQSEAFNLDSLYNDNMTSSDFLDGFLHTFDGTHSQNHGTLASTSNTNDWCSSLFQKQFSVNSIPPLATLSSPSFQIAFPEFSTLSSDLSLENSGVQNEHMNFKRQNKRRHFDTDFEYCNAVTPKPKLTKKSSLKLESSIEKPSFDEPENLERVKTKKGLRKRRRNEWTSEEVALLLSTTKKTD